uniref:Ribosome-recycling factor, mitochondrial n=1 Tax=Trichobilharzia regenti TaxID=157069 RepID=A0AA85IYV4_TRIRE|nr:unnamed protein product [Trichobilharzia regenti]
MNRLFSICQLSSRSLFNSPLLSLWKENIVTSACTLNTSILYSPVRWKSKGGGLPASVKNKKISRDDVVPEVFPLIKADKMEKEFHNLLSRFQASLVQRLSLRMTPQLFADIMIPEENVKLGQVANLLLQNNASHQNTPFSSGTQRRVGLGDQFLLVDLTGRPNLLSAARKAVIAFLDPCKDGSGESKLQPAGQYTFTIRLNTVITQESRQKALSQGRELLQHTIREMDKVHQTHSKLLNTKQVKQEISEDNLFIAREYLRALVKEQHKLAETLWEKKRVELEGDANC